MRSSKTSDAKLINLFLDMLAAEQGAGPNTLDAYRRDLTHFSEFLARSGRGFSSGQTPTLRGYLANLDVRGVQSSSGGRRVAPVRGLVFFSFEGRVVQGQPA